MRAAPCASGNLHSYKIDAKGTIGNISFESANPDVEGSAVQAKIRK